MFKHSLFAIIVFLTVLNQWTYAQSDLPENGPLYLQNEVASVHIILHPDSFELMVTDIEYGHTHEFKATFIYTTSAFSDTIENIGFRLRGNTSLYSEKKSFKVSFNSFSQGGSYHGVEKLNLNGEHNDVSMMRSKLGWELIRNSEIPGSRTSYVRLYVNEEYRGLYLNVEHFDENFVQKYYGQKIGNLYKCLWPATLEYISDNPDDYKVESGGRRIYELKTNIEEDDYSGLAHFINILHSADDNSFECELEEIFNVDDYLKHAAIEVLIAHWDGYIVNKNNFYLYENPKTQKIEWISYDLDNTLGIDWFNINWATTNFYQWNFESRPLYDRLMESEKYRNQFSFYINQLMESIFNPSIMINRAYDIQNLVYEAAIEDEFKALDYGFSNEDFLNAIDEAWGGHVTYGIADFVNQRYLYAQSILESFEDPVVIKEVRDSLITLSTRAVQVLVENEPDSVVLDIYENNNLVQSLQMYDNGFYLDQEAEDLIYGMIHTTSEDHFNYQVRGYLNGEMVEKFCMPRKVWTSLSNHPLRLNEIVANNSSIITDEYGDYEDWIELVQTSSTSIQTENLFLTDEISCPDKWPLPINSIDPQEFLMVWADDQVSQGSWHSNFKLSSSGESIALYTIEDDAYRIIDLIEYPSLAIDEPYGRVEDGFGEWDVLQSPTPGYSNIISSILENPNEYNHITVYPNPTSDYVNIQCQENCEIYIYNVIGEVRLKKSIEAFEQIDISHLSSGIYLLEVSIDKGKHIVKLIKD